MIYYIRLGGYITDLMYLFSFSFQLFNYSLSASLLFSLIELQSASPIHIAHIIPVSVSETWNRVFKNIIAARAKIAQNAPCSRYLYFASVHCLTSIIVRLLTNIAQIQSPNAMMKIFLLKANAQITPSNEKLASNTSRYKNKDNQTL